MVDVYGYCDANCKHKVLTVAQCVDLIQQMAANGFQVPSDYLPKTAVNSIVEQNTGKEIGLFVGTQAEYDEWAGDKSNLFAIITDDKTLQDLLDKLGSLEASSILLDTRVNNIINGTTTVKKAKYSTNANNAIPTTAMLEAIKKLDNDLKAGYVLPTEYKSRLEEIYNNATWHCLEMNNDGVLKCGDIIIPQKKLLWTGSETTTTGSWDPVVIDISNYGLSRNAILEAEIRIKTASDASIFVKFRANNDYVNQFGTMVVGGQLYGSNEGDYADLRCVTFGCDVNESTQLVTKVVFNPAAKPTASSTPAGRVTVLNIWQVIE